MARDSKIIYLDEELNNYGKSNAYPFHMPGHKRVLGGEINPDKIDITEIDGFDNLHHAEGILKDASNRLAKLYKAERSFMLINGSTCGILAAVSAATRRGDRILIARNSHKAVYHAAYLGELRVSYVYPEATAAGIQGSISPESVKAALEAEPDIRAVVITSPTYDGVVSDIKAIAETVHGYGIPLIVDGAHGAHFAFSDAFAKDSLMLGADVCIESLHKTLPAFTQTAVLNVSKNSLIDMARLERYLGIYQTSSPSYILMAGIDRCSRMLEEASDSMFEEYIKRLDAFYEKCTKLKNISVEIPADPGIFDRDRTKILIKAKMPGQWVYDKLRTEHDIQLEMAASSYCTALSSVMDTEEGFDRLSLALSCIDKEIDGIDVEALSCPNAREIYVPMTKHMEISQAMDAAFKEISINESAGYISAEFVYLYPPGIPIVAPGEMISEKTLSDILTCQQLGMEIEGLNDKNAEIIRVINGRQNA